MLFDQASDGWRQRHRLCDRRCRRCRWRRCRCRRRLNGCCGCRGRGRGRSSGSRCRRRSGGRRFRACLGFVDPPQQGTDLDRRAFRRNDFRQGAGRRRRHLDRDLVGFQFDQNFIARDRFAGHPIAIEYTSDLGVFRWDIPPEVHVTESYWFAWKAFHPDTGIWGEDDARAYLGLAMPGFPNFFCTFGPNTFAGHGGSGILTLELEVRYVMEMIKKMLDEGIASVDCRQDVHDEYNERLATTLQDTIWAHPGMTTYYRNDRGRIVINSPYRNVDFYEMTKTADLAEFVTEPMAAGELLAD